MSKESAKSEHFTVRLEEHTANRIGHVTDAYGLTNSQLIRQLIRFGLREIENDGLDAIADPLFAPGRADGGVDWGGAIVGGGAGAREIVATNPADDEDVRQLQEAIEWDIG